MNCGAVPWIAPEASQGLYTAQYQKHGESHGTGQPETEVGRGRQPAKVVEKRDVPSADRGHSPGRSQANCTNR
jgi:hypothetical protein